MSQIIPKISVYIVSHNYGQYLEKAIESVLRQSIDNWELFLINDASTDNTQEIMNFYAGIEHIHLIQGEGKGLIPIANKVLNIARGEYIIRLDADDIFDENILLVLSNYLDRHPDVALVFPDYYLMDATGISYAGIRKESLDTSDHIQDAPPHGACTMFRRTILQAIGGYDEGLAAQDGFYVWSRIREKYKVRNVNLPLFYYRQHGKNLTANIRRIAMARQQIKKMACDRKEESDAAVVAIIPCREHYDFTQSVWREKIGDITLLELALDKCLRSDMFDKIVVTADTEEVLPYLENKNDPRCVFVQRTHDSTFRSRSITETLEKIITELNLPPKTILLICYPQAPFTKTETLEEAVHTLIMFDADSAFAATPIEAPLYVKGAYGMRCINPDGYAESDFTTVYEESRTLFALKSKNLQFGGLFGRNSICFPAEKEEHVFISNAQILASARWLVRESNL